VTRIIAVTGLNKEAALIASSEIEVLVGGGDSQGLRAELRRRASGAAGLISIGIAGALDPALKVGDAVIGDAVIADARRYEADARWAQALLAKLPDARAGAVSGVDRIVADVAAKHALRQADGSIAVDMESHIVAEIAGELGLRFAVVRFISDSAGHVLPKAALGGMRPDGSMDLAAVLASIARDPRQIPALIRTGRDAGAAFRALLRGRQVLGAALGFADVEGGDPALADVL